MISCFQLKPCVKCFSNLFKKVFKLKKLVVKPKMAQPVELDEEPVDRQLNRSTPSSTGRTLARPVKPPTASLTFFFYKKAPNLPC